MNQSISLFSLTLTFSLLTLNRLKSGTSSVPTGTIAPDDVTASAIHIFLQEALDGFEPLVRCANTLSSLFSYHLPCLNNSCVIDDVILWE